MRPSARHIRHAFPRRALVGALAFLLAFLRVGEALAATIVIAVQSTDGRPLPGAVIAVHSLAGAARPGVPVQAVMDQIDRAFEPDLLVIPVGSTIEFPNSDSVSHQIYSFSPAKKFQLPLYRGKPYPPVRFDQAGLVTLGCNIHDSMLAYVVVTDAPFFGRTDAAGSWSAEVPRGTYRVTVWHPRMREDGELEREMTIGEGDRTSLTLRLLKPLQPAPLQERGHSWDAY
ncbi:MAG TPA: methylamine utilization protein [Steroidobacteraceae bacterium]|nr:methylamine utilization protein [Steroidobacteraceae bacterium]